MDKQTIELSVVDSAGKKVASRECSAGIFQAPVKTHLFHQFVRWQRAKARAGTHLVKTRATASGGGVKPWKQKGTGRARAGSNTSPLWIGGGIAHGPKLRDYGFQLNKKERRASLAGALSVRQAEGKLICLQDFDLKEISTRDAVIVLKNIGIEPAARVTVVIPSGEEKAMKSLRNIEGARVILPEGLNVSDVLNSEYLVIVAGALEVLESRLS